MGAWEKVVKIMHYWPDHLPIKPACMHAIECVSPHYHLHQPVSSPEQYKSHPSVPSLELWWRGFVPSVKIKIIIIFTMKPQRSTTCIQLALVHYIFFMVTLIILTAVVLAFWGCWGTSHGPLLFAHFFFKDGHTVSYTPVGTIAPAASWWFKSSTLLTRMWTAAM